MFLANGQQPTENNKSNQRGHAPTPIMVLRSVAQEYVLTIVSFLKKILHAYVPMTSQVTRYRYRCGGFSLIELLAVTSILIILSTIILSNNAKFGGAITLRNVAYDIALSIRQSQTYGIAVRKFGSGEGSFGAGYGVHLELASVNGYVIFADAVNPNGLYDAGESVESLTLHGGYFISDLCATESGGAGQEACGFQKLDILFQRPDPDAYIRVNDIPVLYQQARIIVESPRGDKLAVIIELSGQISVQNI
jgi:hypothetical protein